MSDYTYNEIYSDQKKCIIRSEADANIVGLRNNNEVQVVCDRKWGELTPSGQEDIIWYLNQNADLNSFVTLSSSNSSLYEEDGSPVAGMVSLANLLSSISGSRVYQKDVGWTSGPFNTSIELQRISVSGWGYQQRIRSSGGYVISAISLPFKDLALGPSVTSLSPNRWYMLYYRNGDPVPYDSTKTYSLYSYFCDERGNNRYSTSNYLVEVSQVPDTNYLGVKTKSGITNNTVTGSTEHILVRIQ